MVGKQASSNGSSRRAVIVAGVRTPFVKAFGQLIKVDTIGLGVAAVGALLARSGVARKEIDGIVWGGVILPGLAPNVGREIALDLRLPPSVEAMTVTRACASGLQAITSAAAAIERGDADVMIAGGSDSTSNAEIKLPQKVVHAMAPLAFGKATPADYLGVLSQLWPINEILPQRPKIAERTTGEVMGEAADKMARRNEVSRASAGRVRLSVAPTRGGGDRLGALRLRGGADHDVRRRGAQRQPGARRHQRREARQAEAGVRHEGRDRDGGQLLAAHRRGGGGAADERGEGESARSERRWRRCARGPTSASIPPTSCCSARRWRCPRRSIARASRSPTSTSSICTRRSPRRC